MEMFKRKSKVDVLFEKQEEARKKQQKIVEDLMFACKDLFSTPNGIFFLKYLFKMCFWGEQDTNINHDVLLYKKGRRDTWAIIRNVIPKDILAQIEIYDNSLEE